MSDLYGAPDLAHEPPPQVAAIIAQYPDVDSVVAAARQVKAAGYQRWDVHSPFPIHGIDAVMGIRPTVLPWLALVGGIVGCAAGLGLAYFTNAVDYKFLISGKPNFSLPANIPVVFETTVLLAAFAVVFGMLGLNKLPMLYNPLFRSQRFRRVTADRFFVVIEADDPDFDVAKIRALLEQTDPEAIEEVYD